jgi:glycosidase
MERYPRPALLAMMNLLDSHDTSRALFMLDHNTDPPNPAIYQNPNYDWSDAVTRLKGVTLLQFTLPGAPTVYYGDEVGLVGPPAYDGAQWQDDPYNRQPYPPDQTARCSTPTCRPRRARRCCATTTPLAATRNVHPALRTASFDPLSSTTPTASSPSGAS